MWVFLKKNHQWHLYNIQILHWYFDKSIGCSLVFQEKPTFCCTLAQLRNLRFVYWGWCQRFILSDDILLLAEKICDPTNILLALNKLTYASWPNCITGDIYRKALYEIQWLVSYTKCVILGLSHPWLSRLHPIMVYYLDTLTIIV